MTARLISVVSAILIAMPALAQPDFGDRDPRDMDADRPTHPDDEHPPRLVLGPPDGFEPPEDMPEMPEDPEAAKRMGIEMFFHLMDRSGDGTLDWDEFSHWVQDFVDPGEMHDRRGEMDERRDRMGDAGDRMGDARDRRGGDSGEHMDPEGDHPEGDHMDERRDRMGDARDRMGDARDRRGDARDRRGGDSGEHMDPEGELPDEDHMDERRQRMADARDRRGDARDRRGDAREHMDPEGELPDEDHMDERRQRMADARDRRGDARDRRGDAREHMDPEGELPDEDHMDERRQRMGDARDRMGNARDRMGDARQHMGNARDRMEEEGREHMEHMMMDAFRKDAHPDLARLPNAPRCSDTLRERELNPREEGAGCNDHEGNLMFRTICNMPGFGAAAISLPAGRAASCFGLEALRGSIGFEILTEDGHTVWDLSMGPESYEHLELDEGIYHIKATSGDHGGAITISFVDVSVDR